MHGCFWHMHDCPRFKLPSGENAEFWKAKLARNAERDEEVAASLSKLGWRRLVVWECCLVGRGRIGTLSTTELVIEWLNSDKETGEVSGRFPTVTPEDCGL